jgi:hypothetical protein
MSEPTLQAGMLLRIKKQCTKSRSIRENGEFALLIRRRSSRTGIQTSFLWDALFPSGQRVIFIKNNWDIIS